MSAQEIESKHRNLLGNLRELLILGNIPLKKKSSEMSMHWESKSKAALPNVFPKVENSILVVIASLLEVK